MAIKTEFKFDTSEIEANIAEYLPQGLIESGEFLVDKIRDNTPSKSGRLKGSISFKTNGFTSDVDSPAKSEDIVSGNPAENELIVGTNVPYAKYVEYNQGFMSSAVDESGDQLLKILADNLKEAFE